MLLREQVNLLVKENNFEKLASLALQDRGVTKYLLRLLYHPYGVERWQAIEGLGYIAKALSQAEPEQVRELLRRLLWSMNDESGTTSWSAPEAIGEIIVSQPELYKEFVSIVVHASEEEIFHRGMVWTLGRVGQSRPDLVKEFVPLLTEFLANPRPEVRGYAANSLGKLGIEAVEALPHLQQLLNDRNLVEVYEHQKLINKSVADLASQAIANIT